MGASSYLLAKKGHLTQSELNLWLGDEQAEDRCVNGHRDGYSADSNTVERVKLCSRAFTDRWKAEDYIMERAQKWEFFVAVHVTDASLPEGEREFTVMGGWVAE